MKKNLPISFTLELCMYICSNNVFCSSFFTNVRSDLTQSSQRAGSPIPFILDTCYPHVIREQTNQVWEFSSVSSRFTASFPVFPSVLTEWNFFIFIIIIIIIIIILVILVYHSKSTGFIKEWLTDFENAGLCMYMYICSMYSVVVAVAYFRKS